MKELENNWMKKWESVKEKTVCPVDLNTYFEQEEIAGKSGDDPRRRIPMGKPDSSGRCHCGDSIFVGTQRLRAGLECRR